MATNPPISSLDLDRAVSVLRTAAIGHTLDYHDCVDSTMSLARQLALRPDIRSGTIVVAEEQTAGRGRLQRKWEAPAGRALLLSIVLKQGQLPALPAHLPMLAGLAAVRALATLELGDVQVGLKWPNDLIMTVSQGEPVAEAATARKVGGIIVESSISHGRLELAILGIGVNVNQTADELPIVKPPALTPTSLALELGRQIDRTDLLIRIALSLAEVLALPAPLLFDSWRDHLWTLGQQVTVFLGDGREIHGVATDVAENGSLLVNDGYKLRSIEAGDVSLRGAT